MPEPTILDGPALWSPQAHMPTVLGRQLVVDRAEGSTVHTVDGRRLFDGTAGLWHANIGHANPAVARAAFEQMQRLETYHTFGRYANDRAIELAERLAALSPIPDAKVILGSGGSDAIDTACKLARRHWQLRGQHDKTIVLSRDRAYHGLHAYGTSIAGLEFNRDGYGTDSLVPETARVDADDAAAVAATIERIGAHRIAAIVAEPIQGTGGVHPPAPGYLEALGRLAARHDILLIADEVITGFGRTGHWFATERFGLRPDMLTFAKGVTSGYAPLGGVLVGRRIWEAFYADAAETPILRQGVTYAGHATAAAVALANLDVLESDGLVERAGALEGTLRAALDELAASHDEVVQVRCAGFLGGVTLREDRDAAAMADALVETGWIVRPLQGNTLQISPPFIATDAEVTGLVAAIGDAVSTTSA